MEKRGDPLFSILLIKVDNYMEEENNFLVAADLIMGFLLILFGGSVIRASLKMKVYKTFLDAPGFFPLLLGIIFIILGTMMAVSAIRRKGYVQMKRIFTRSNFAALFKSIRFRRVMTLIALMVLYIFILIGRVHFALATAIYLFLTLFYLKSTTIIKIIIISIIASLAISGVFTMFFHIPLP